MNKKPIGILAALSLCVVLFAGSAVAAPKVYRFLDENGELVVSHTIPTDRVKHGYDVLDGSTYRVLETVPPQLTEEQAQAKARRDHDLAVCLTKQRRVNALYRSLDDIDYSEEQVMKSLDNRIANANANLVVLRSQLSDLQSRAAQLERTGTEPPVTLLANIERAESQISNLEGEIDSRRQEQDNKRGEFDDDRRILKIADCHDAVGPVGVQPNAAVSKATH